MSDPIHVAVKELRQVEQRRAELIKMLRDNEPDPNTAKYALFKGIQMGNIFFSANSPGEDMTKLADGTLAYEIIGYADSSEEAQCKLYGRPQEPLII
jgi:hypothetical protein